MAKPCVWWDYKIEYHTTESATTARSWRVIDRATSVAPFSLRDAGGECQVGPVGADVTPTVNETWYGDQPRPACLPDLERHEAGARRANTAIRSELIGAGAASTVLGELRSRSIVESIEREVGKVVVEWKHDQAGLLREVRSQP